MTAKPEDEDDKSTLASATATPAPDYDGDSKMGSVDSKALLGADTDRKIDFKPQPEMEDLTADFDVDVRSSPFFRFLPLYLRLSTWAI